MRFGRVNIIKFGKEKILSPSKIIIDEGLITQKEITGRKNK